MTTEDAMEQRHLGLKAGVWIESFGTNLLSGVQAPADLADDAPNSVTRMSQAMMDRYHLRKPTPVESEARTTNELDSIPVRFRAVNLNRAGNSSANSGLAFAVERAMQASDFLDKDGTKLSGELEQGDDTFTFDMVLKLKALKAQQAPGKKG